MAVRVARLRLSRPPFSRQRYAPSPTPHNTTPYTPNLRSAVEGITGTFVVAGAIS